MAIFGATKEAKMIEYYNDSGKGKTVDKQCKKYIVNEDPITNSALILQMAKLKIIEIHHL